MTTINRLSAVAALAVGIAFVGTDIWLNDEYVWSAEHGITAMLLATSLASIAAAIWPHYIIAALRTGNRALAAAGIVGCLVMTGFSFTASLGRSADSYQQLVAGKQQANGLVTSFDTRIKQAEDALADAKEREKTERKGLCRDRCLQAIADQKTARAEIASLTAAKAASGVVIEDDVLGKYLSGLTGLDRSTIELYQPMLLPLGSLLAGAFFMSLGLGMLAAPAAPLPTPSAPAAPATPAVRQAVETLSKQAQVLYWHQTMLGLDGRAPSRQWLAAKVGCDKSTVSRALAKV
jgi:hypothetical protein